MPVFEERAAAENFQGFQETMAPADTDHRRHETKRRADSSQQQMGSAIDFPYEIRLQVTTFVFSASKRSLVRFSDE